jgi:hypothetical protein
MANNATTPGGLNGVLKYDNYAKIDDAAPGPGVNEPSVFSGGDGLIVFDGSPLARRVESSVELSLEWDEVYFQGQYTVGALVLKAIKISGGIKQATANLEMVRKFCGMSEHDFTDLENTTIRHVRYIAPVDIVLVLDKSMLPETVASYEAVMIYNAVMNNFSLPISAGSTVFNDQKWTAMNLAWRSSKSNPTVKLVGPFWKVDYLDNVDPTESRDGGFQNSSW